MALFGLFKRRRSLTGGKLVNKGDYRRTEYQPTVIFKPHARTRLTPITKNPLQRQGRFLVIKRIALALLAFVILSFLVYLIYQLFQNPYFALEQFNIIGNKTVSQERMDSLLKEFKGKNIFLVQSGSVEKAITDNFPIFNGVEVDKYYPNILFIKISEREPKLIYINLSGIYQVDAKGDVLELINAVPSKLNQEQVNIYRGYGNPNDILVQDRLKTEFSIANKFETKTVEEQLQLLGSGFLFDQIKLSEKERVLKILQKEIGAVIDDYLKKNNEIVDNGAFASFPRVDAIELKKYEAEEKIALDRLNLTLDLNGLFSTRSIPVSRIVWEGELLVTVVLDDQRVIVFGLNRKSSEQFEDYLLVLNQLKKEGHDFKKIDVSSTKVSVKR